jgi:DNA-binding HxlR family transcriptional regulator
MHNRVRKHSTCEGTMKLLGDYWTLRIVDALRSEEVRFCELQRILDNVNPVTLTNRLKKLEEARLVSRSEETIDKISVAYSLSELGREVLPIIKALDRFSAKAGSSIVG